MARPSNGYITYPGRETIMASVTVDRLEPGDHACLTFSDAAERRDLLAAFVQAGARNGEKVICYTDTPDSVPAHVLRICRQHVPPGVRVAGELDASRLGALRDALAEAVRLDPDVHLNLNGLRSLEPEAGHMVVIGDARIGRTLRVAGATGVRQLRVLMRDA